MLQQQHPDFAAYVKNPDKFVSDLYREIRAEYASPYTDSVEDVAKSLGFLDSALHDGITRQVMLEKLKEMKELTSVQFRPATAKIIRDGYYRKNFTESVKITPAKAAEPWTGPMPNRF